MSIMQSYKPCEVKFDGKTTASIAYQPWPVLKKEKPFEPQNNHLRADKPFEANSSYQVILNKIVCELRQSYN